MPDVTFEWDDDKAWANWSKHRVTFEEARAVFEDPNRIEEIDDETEEELWIARGLASGTCLVVIWTERNGRIRIISATRASRREQAQYYDTLR